LDEISAAPQSVQAAAYQITLDRSIGEHKLPENCLVIAAGNRVSDKSVVVKMPKALANRLCHMEIAGSFDSWRKWAVQAGIHRKIIGFLMFRQDYLMRFEPSNEELAFATPRSWEMASNILNFVSEDEKSVYALLAGCVGSGMVVEFCAWCKVFQQMPSMEDIFGGRCRIVPQEADVLYATVASMVDYAKKHKDEMEKIGNSIVYAGKLPPDFAAMLMENYMVIEDGYKNKLLKMSEFASWLTKHGSKFLT
jgi:hypothetical protein